MKERITYVIREPAVGYDPSGLEVTNSSFAVGSLDGAKEQQITFSLDELPQEIVRSLKAFQELRIRWATPRPYISTAPYVSRVIPGVHAFYTPVQGKEGKQICPLIRNLFAPYLDCKINSAYTIPPNLSARFSHSASRQYHAYVPTSNDLINWIAKISCTEFNFACKLRVHDLLSADYLDADYDSLSHSLVLRAFWSASHLSDKLWWETHLLSEKGSLEVGVLINEKPEEEEELRYSGFLTQVGKDEKPAPTLFSFPSRHHPLPASAQYTTAFTKPTGLHPTLTLTIESNALSQPSSNCYLHTYLNLPSALFIDKYPLSDPLFLASHNLKALHAISGNTDLEAPDWVGKEWGSAALFEIAVPNPNTMQGKEDFNVTIPTHLRYLPPRSPTATNITNGQTSHSLLTVANPLLFWACTAETGSQFPTSPFDRTNLGYDGLFGPKTMFYHFNPTASSPEGLLVSQVDVPVLDLGKTSAWVVEWGTVLVILLGTVWVGLSLLGRGKGVRADSEEEKKE